MAATTNNTTTTSYEDKVVTTNLKKINAGGTADTDESFGEIVTRLRLNGGTLTATTTVTIESDTASGQTEINELCEDVMKHFTEVKAAATALIGEQ